jgi:hypothetical protein
VIDTRARVVGQRAEHHRAVARHRRHADVLGPLRVAVDHVCDLRVAEPAEAEAEVERRAEHDDQVGALLEQPACAQERQLVARGQGAAAEPVVEARHAQVLDGCLQLGPRAVPVHVAADDERGALGLRDQVRQGRDLVGVGCRAATGALVDTGQLATRRAEHVEREVEERGTAVRGHARRGRGVHRRRPPATRPSR